MATSFGALCTDFYVNQKVAVRMDLPCDRETILHFFDRVRAEQPEMSRFRRYSDELALESRRQDGAYTWLALQQNTIRSGSVNPEAIESAYDLHRLVLRQAPYHLTLSPLDIEHQEVLFGFDLEAKANHHEIVYEALFAETPVAALFEQTGVKPLDCQPFFGVALDDDATLQAFFEVKTATSRSQVRAEKYRTEPISIFVTLRKLGPVGHVDDLVTTFTELASRAEYLTGEVAVPHLLTPISRAITSSA